MPGLTQIVLSKTSVDAYNPKVVRSTMGAIFRVKIIEAENLVETLKNLKKHKFKIVATSLGGTKNIYEMDYNKKVIVIGNESKGVSKEILDVADEKTKIPMLGKTESLNAGIATGVILYEYVRRKLEQKWLTKGIKVRYNKYVIPHDSKNLVGGFTLGEPLP